MIPNRHPSFATALRRVCTVVAGAALLLGSQAGLAGGEAAADDLQRVNADSRGRQGNGDTYFTSIDRSGGFTLSASVASNIVPGSSQGIYLRNLATGVSENVHVSSAGTPGTCCGFRAYASEGADVVAFSSTGTNLVSGTAPVRPIQQVYVRDRVTGSTTLVSRARNNQVPNDSSEVIAISGDGRYVLFNSRATNLVQETSGVPATLIAQGAPDYTNSLTPFGGCFLYDRNQSRTTLVSKMPGSYVNTFAYCDGVSDDGGSVVFHTSASGIDPSDTNNASDVFFADVSNDEFVRIKQPDGSQFPNGIGRLSNSVSADSKPIAAVTSNGALVSFPIRRQGVFLHNSRTNQTQSMGDQSLSVFTQSPSISNDGSAILASYIGVGPALIDTGTGAMKTIGFPNDLYNRLNFGLDTLISLEPGAMSGDGSKIVFISRSKYFNRGYQPKSGTSFDLDSEPFLANTQNCGNDPKKMYGGICGCGFVEQDANSDGVVDCGARAGRAGANTVVTYPPFPITDRPRWVLQQFLPATTPPRGVRSFKAGATLESRAARLEAKASPQVLNTLFQFVAQLQKANGSRSTITVNQPVRSNVVDLARKLPRGSTFRNVLDVKYRVITRDRRGRTTGATRFSPALRRPSTSRRQ